VGGPTPVSFVEILDQIGAALGRATVRKVHVPLGAVKLATRAVGWLPFYPVTTDQLTMLEEESVTDPSRFYGDLGIAPEPLALGLARTLATP
jgi:NADH dehydrogenase